MLSTFAWLYCTSSENKNANALKLTSCLPLLRGLSRTLECCLILLTPIIFSIPSLFLSLRVACLLDFFFLFEIASNSNPERHR
uniref:Transport protein particle subunit trs31 n=1 Tax=Rhizophora mucronata TaxID=61149 RepID=A0A2P2KXC1_RHIMU